MGLGAWSRIDARRIGSIPKPRLVRVSIGVGVDVARGRPRESVLSKVYTINENDATDFVRHDYTPAQIDNENSLSVFVTRPNCASSLGLVAPAAKVPIARSVPTDAVNGPVPLDPTSSDPDR